MCNGIRRLHHRKPKADRWRIYRIIAYTLNRRPTDQLFIGSSEKNVFLSADIAFPDADSIDVYEITRRPN